MEEDLGLLAYAADGHAVLGAESGTQRSVTLDEPEEGAAQGRRVQPREDSDGGGDVVSAALRTHLVKEPERLLTPRQRVFGEGDFRRRPRAFRRARLGLQLRADLRG